VGVYNGECVERAVFTMRAALGYNTAAPRGWNPGARCTADVVSLVGNSFPDRIVKAWCTKECWENATPTKNMVYSGTEIINGKWSNDYLFAFVYGTETEGHMVIGWPSAYGDMKLSLTIGVRL